VHYVQQVNAAVKAIRVFCHFFAFCFVFSPCHYCQ